MITSSIILAHFKEREGNLKRIVDDLLGGTVVPQEVIVFIDNPEIAFTDDRVTIIRSSKSFLPIIRFGIGATLNSDYCFFLDDDLTVRSKTLENLVYYAGVYPAAILGFEGSILGKTDTPYSNDTPIKRGNHPKEIEVDVIIRTYFAPVSLIPAGLRLRADHPELPKKSLDDVFLCLGNKYLNSYANYVIPVNEESDLTELPDGGVGQSLTGEHYGNRNIACKKLREIYETK